MLPNLSYELCGSHLGGLSQLFVIPADQVLSVPEHQEYLLGADIVLEEGTSMSQLEFPEDAADFKEDSAENDHGLLYKSKLEVFMPKDTPQMAQWTNALGKIKFCVLLYCDNNGFWKVVGSPEFPLTISSSFESGKSGANKSGTTFLFSGESLDKAFFYYGMEIGDQEPNNSGAPVTIVDGKGKILATVQPGGTFQIKSGFSYGFRIIK